MDIASLASFCTPRQLEVLEALERHGNQRAAAAELGCDKAYVGKVLAAVQKKAGGSPVRTEKASPPRSEGLKILVLPDVQAKPGVDFSYLKRIGQYALDKRPDVIVMGGDFADMQSLSSYDKGKRAFEGRRYKRDIEAGQFAMQAFLGPIDDFNKTAKRPYTPRKIGLYGNHEWRVNRATNEDAMLEGMLSVKDLAYEEYGWEMHDFLEVVLVEGVAFSHYFTSGVMGRPVTTAQALLTKKHMSCVAFHQQGLQIATSYRADGALLTSIICGSCYEHNEDYLGPQGNKHWRGFLMLHDVRDGVFDLMPVSLDFINKRYPHITYDTPAYSMPTADEIAAGKC